MGFPRTPGAPASRRHAARRPAVLVWLALAVALAGCGWTPLYADRDTGPADAELRAIKVAPIPERIGQRLAMALRESFNPDGTPSPQRYRLDTLLTATRSDLGIQQTGLGSRGKLDATVTFWLRDIKTGTALLATSVHTSESFDILANNYASVVAEEDARIRAVEELRRDIVTRLTLFLQRRAAETKP
jgi:LPS-assembly lipoprotein